MSRTSRTSATRFPVPHEQRPLNEFTEMKEAWLFAWLTLPVAVYVRKLLIVWAINWVLVGWPIAAVSYPPAKAPGHFFISASGGAAFLLTLLLLHLYMGWRHVNNRLTKPTVEYEESGWYDGQVWTKTEDVLSKDQLVATYEVRPIFERLHWTFATLSGLAAIATVLWPFVY